MKLIYHFLASLIISIVFYPIFGPISLLAFITGYLIDIDHILYYFYKFKTIELNLKKIYRYFRNISKNLDEKEYKRSLRLFHNFELTFILMLLTIIYHPILPALIAHIVHLLMDIYYEMKFFKRIHNFSIIRRLLK